MRLICSGIAMTMLVIGLCLAGCSKPEEHGASIEVTNAWVRPTIGEARNTAAYMTVTNHGDEADRLVAASTPDAMNTQLHQTQMDGDVMSMSAVEGGIEIPANSSVELAPQGMHIMVMGLSKPLQKGETVPFALTFEKAGAVAVSIRVGEPSE